MISMNLTILVGLSVDYIVHMAEGYSLSDCSTRRDKIREMLENVGISIVMGAVTTIGAAVFMIFAKIMFFFQFGIFLFCISSFSVIFSLLVFPAVLSVIGPENETGNITKPFRKLHQKWIGRREDDVKCHSCRGKGFRRPNDEDNTNENSPNGFVKVNVTQNVIDSEQTSL